MIDLRRALTVTSVVIFMIITLALVCTAAFVEENSASAPQPTPTPSLYILLNS
jgi:hypothetical protein